MKKIIFTAKAPNPIGPYSQAVLVGNTLYLSGQVCIEPITGELVNKDIIAETKQVMNNLSAVLEAAEMDFSHVVKSIIFVKNLGDFATINEVYGGFFTSNFPARETVEVSRLPKDVNVEISCIAIK